MFSGEGVGYFGGSMAVGFVALAAVMYLFKRRRDERERNASLGRSPRLPGADAPIKAMSNPLRSRRVKAKAGKALKGDGELMYKENPLLKSKATSPKPPIATPRVTPRPIISMDHENEDHEDEEEEEEEEEDEKMEGEGEETPQPNPNNNAPSDQAKAKGKLGIKEWKTLRKAVSQNPDLKPLLTNDTTGKLDLPKGWVRVDDGSSTLTYKREKDGRVFDSLDAVLDSLL